MPRDPYWWLDEKTRPTGAGISTPALDTTDPMWWRDSNIAPQTRQQEIQGATTAGELMDISSLSESNIESAGQITTYGEEPPDPNKPGLLSRIFDVLSRPNYAMAEATSRGLEEGAGLGDVLSGAWQGLQGREKTTFSDVLEEQGVENRFVKGVGGFALDVLLDPTTYVGAGVVKSVGKEAVEKAAVRASHSAYKSKRAGSLADNAKDALKLEHAAKGLPKPTAGQLNKVAEEVKRAHALDVASRTKAQLIQNRPGKLTMNFMGKPVFESEGIYKGVAKVGDWIVNTRAGSQLRKGFKTSEAFPGELNVIKRMFEGRSVGEFDRVAKTVREKFAHLTKEERARIAHATEEGVDLSGILAKSGDDLGDHQRFFQTTMDDLFDIEVNEFGFLDPQKKMDNYVYHVYRNTNHPDYKKFKNNRAKLVGSQTFGPGLKRHIPTLKDAKAAGLDPIDDAGEILLRRLEKHWKTTARYDFENKLIQDYGIIVPLKQVRVKGKKQLPKVEAVKQGPFPNNMWMFRDATGKPHLFLSKKSALKGAQKHAQPVYKNVADANLRKLAKELDLAKVESPLIKGQEAWVPRAVERVFNATKKAYEDDDVAGELLQFFDKMQNIWKTQATVINPGHHFRNMIGDIWLNYLDGVTNPKVYQHALKIVTKKDTAVKVGHKTLSGFDVENAYIRMGLKSGFTRSEIGTFKNRVIEGVREFSEGREDVARFAHFIDAWKKEAKGIKPGKRATLELEKAAERAAKRVRKWNIDYGDFTDFETRTMKRLIPFYSFARKNLPLQLEAVAMRPGRVVALPKGQRAIEQLLGTGRNEAYVEETIPKWLRDLEPLQITGGENPSFLTLGVPIQDIQNYDPQKGIGGIAQQLLSMTTPTAQIPMELAFGRDLFTGAPIEESGLQYASSFFPSARVASQLVADDLPVGEKIGKGINYLVNPGYQPVSNRRRQGELRRQQDIIQAVLSDARKKAQEELLGGG